MLQLNDLLIDSKVARAYVEPDLFEARVERMTSLAAMAQPSWFAQMLCQVALNLGRALIATGQHLQRYATRRTMASLET